MAVISGICSTDTEVCETIYGLTAISFNLIVNGTYTETVARITNFIETDDTAVFGNSINVVSVNTE